MRCILGWDEDGGVPMGKDNVTVSMLDGMHPIVIAILTCECSGC